MTIKELADNYNINEEFLNSFEIGESKDITLDYSLDYLK